MISTKRKGIIIYMVEYELFGRRKFWPESLDKQKAKDIRNTLKASNVPVKVHVVQMKNPEFFVEPLAVMRKVYRHPKKRRKPKE